MPFLRIVPTTGATEENCAEFMGKMANPGKHSPLCLFLTRPPNRASATAAGAWGIGFTGVLFDPEDMANGRFDRIEERARRMVAKVRPGCIHPDSPCQCTLDLTR